MTPFLFPRQQQVAQLLAHGLSRQQIADEMGVTLETVKSHLKWVKLNLDANNTTHAVAIALRAGLID